VDIKGLDQETRDLIEQNQDFIARDERLQALMREIDEMDVEEVSDRLEYLGKWVREKINDALRTARIRELAKLKVANPDIAPKRLAEIVNSHDDAFGLFHSQVFAAKRLDLSQHSTDKIPSLASNPSANLEEIRARQSVLDYLLAIDTNQKGQVIRRAFEFGEGVRALMGIDRDEKRRAENAMENLRYEYYPKYDEVKEDASLDKEAKEKRIKELEKEAEAKAKELAAKCQLDYLREADPEKIKQAIQILESPEADERDNRQAAFVALGHSNELFHAVDNIAGLPEKLTQIHDAVATLKSEAHPFLQRVGSELEALASKIEIPSWETLIEEFKKDRLEALKSKIGAVDSLLGEIQAVVIFCYDVLRDEYTRAHYDANQPAFYKTGWNLSEDKMASSWDKKEGKKIDQVTNDSPADKPTTIFTGSNMAGKTFGMKQIMYLQIIAQSLGYVPAGENNFHIFDNIAYLDRADTDGSNNLSAFGKEAEMWKEIIQAVVESGGRSMVFADEGFSTTSPEDQFKLLVATFSYLKELSVKAHGASHNNLFIDSIKQDPETGLYHFEIAHDETGKITFLHKMLEGIDGSHAIEVARALGMPEEVLKIAEDFLAGNPTGITPDTPTYRPVERYTPEERERMKGQPGSLRCLFGQEDEMIWSHGPYGDEKIKWRFRADHEDYDEYKHELKPGARKPETKPELPTLFQLLSSDGDFRWGRHADFDSDLLGWIKDRGITDSRELHERQQMFEAITENPEAMKKFEKAINDFWSLGWFMLNPGNPEVFNGFNQKMFEGASYLKDKGDIEIALKTIEINAALLGLDLDKIGIRADVERLKKVMKLQEEFAHLDRCHIMHDDPNREQKAAEQRKRFLALKKEINGLLQMHSKDDHYDFVRNVTADLTVEVAALLEKLAPNIQPIDFDDLTQEQRMALQALTQDYVKGSFDNQAGPLYSRIKEALQKDDSSKMAREALESFDSVHMHRLAKYMELWMQKATYGIRNGAEFYTALREMHKKAKKEVQDRHFGRRESPYRQVGDNREKVIDDARTILKLFEFAKAIKEKGYAKVGFNDTGNISLNNAWSINEEKDKQVRNTTSFDSSEIVKMITGTNMSGKTFYEKQMIWNVLIAHFCGFAPSDAASMPIFDKIFYLDRVNTREDKSLSAFGNEVTFWNQFFGAIQNGQNTFSAVDEAFSTTSPKYQAALTYAAMAYMLKKGQKMVIAGHSHEAISAFAEANGNHTAPYHFKTHVGDDGKIAFDYLMQNGHALSQAIEVAKKMGLPQEIIDRAREIK
jgi:DNA mismatch repair ATPase MutS